MDWEPEDALKTNESDVLAAVNQVVAADLARFKDFIEARVTRPAHGEARSF